MRFRPTVRGWMAAAAVAVVLTLVIMYEGLYVRVMAERQRAEAARREAELARYLASQRVALNPGTVSKVYQPGELARLRRENAALKARVRELEQKAGAGVSATEPEPGGPSASPSPSPSPSTPAK